MNTSRSSVIHWLRQRSSRVFCWITASLFPKTLQPRQCTGDFHTLAQDVFHKPSFFPCYSVDVHLSLCPESVQGHSQAVDVEAESGECSLFPESQLSAIYCLVWQNRWPLPSNQQPLTLPFWKSCLLCCFMWKLTSDTHKHGGSCHRDTDWMSPLFLLRLVRYTLDEFGTARRSAVVRGFIDALTRGGPGGTPRPIEMHSHDPMR